MNNPYEVLGISQDATEEQVKAAYKSLARKYHPDSYADNPLQELASEKMKEVNEAYDEIQRERFNKNKNGDGFYSTPNSSFGDIRAMIAAGKLDEALSHLDTTPPNQRNAEWYFLNGTVQYRRGWSDAAYTSFSAACRMDPGNAEYRAAFDQMGKRQNGFGGSGGYNQGYYGNGGGMGNGGGCNQCDLCSALCCADCLCQSCGGC